VTAGGPLTSNLGGRFVTVHLWHLTVHEDTIVGQHSQHVDGLPAIGSHIDADAHFLQNPDGHFLVDDIVLGNQHPQMTAIEAG
jgi:hypothetical protein